MDMTFTAPCIFGLEGLCANELKFLGVENVRAENGSIEEVPQENIFDGLFYHLQIVADYTVDFT